MQKLCTSFNQECARTYSQFGSMLAWPVILIGLLFNTRSSGLIIDIGILLFSAAVLFQLVTLPVEFDASRRALVMLRTQGILADDELRYTRRVLKSAALTYVASAAAAVTAPSYHTYHKRTQA